jgi:tRNA A37 threonylcarbamoyladenosine dehydratase
MATATTPVNPALQRLALITGVTGLAALEHSAVTVFGLGGVGSWAAEALARSGVGALTLVDSDAVCVTNLNRQVQATVETIGAPKTTALAARLATIAPGCRVTTVTTVFDETTAAQFSASFQPGHYVVDAIDSLTPKLDLIEAATTGGAFLVSSMGMAQKLDPTQIRAASIWETAKCPLARLVRQGLRRRGFTADFTAVYSPENLPRRTDIPVACGTGACLCPAACDHEWCSSKLVINGSAVTVTAAAGMALASVVIKNILFSAKTA